MHHRWWVHEVRTRSGVGLTTRHGSLQPVLHATLQRMGRCDVVVVVLNCIVQQSQILQVVGIHTYAMMLASYALLSDHLTVTFIAAAWLLQIGYIIGYLIFIEFRVEDGVLVSPELHERHHKLSELCDI